MISNAYAQSAAASASGDPLPSFFIIIGMFVLMYFLMIRPQQKRQKEHKAMIEAMAKGDEVVTAGGLAGKVSKLGETYLTLEIANNVEVQVQRTAIVQVLPKGSLK